MLSKYSAASSHIKNAGRRLFSGMAARSRTAWSTREINRRPKCEEDDFKKSFAVSTKMTEPLLSSSKMLSSGDRSGKEPLQRGVFENGI